MPRQFFAAFVLLAAAAAAQTGPAGHWEGTLKAGDRDIGLALDLAQNAKGDWIGSMSVPSQNATGLVVKDLAVNGNSVKFMAVEIQMSKLDLTLAGGKLTGMLIGQRGSVPIEFQRTGEAKVELPPISPAVSKELEGDWEGTLTTPGGEMKVMLHFKNLPDKTVSATIDVPATNASAMPLNDVKQSGAKVEFGLKIAHGSFQGTLNKDATELTGQLSHDEQTMAMSLKKK